MPYFNRFDICEAYLALETDWNVSGVLQEREHRRPRNVRHDYSVSYQLHRMQFKPGASFNGYESLSENGRGIYDAFCVRHRMCSGCDGHCIDLTGETCDMLIADHKAGQEASNG